MHKANGGKSDPEASFPEATHLSLSFNGIMTERNLKQTGAKQFGQRTLKIKQNLCISDTWMLYDKILIHLSESKNVWPLKL